VCGLVCRGVSHIASANLVEYFYKILDAVEKGCNIRGDESDTPGVIID
jgi:hypothetical protein